MLRGDATKGFAQYLLTDSAKNAEPWQLEVLGASEWPSWVEPTAGTFENLKLALDLATPPAAEQQRTA